MTNWIERWKTTTAAVKSVSATIGKALAPAAKARRDPWLDAHTHQREVDARRRPHPNQWLIDRIDEERSGPRWISPSRSRGWLR